MTCLQYVANVAATLNCHWTRDWAPGPEEAGTLANVCHRLRFVHNAQQGLECHNLKMLYSFLPLLAISHIATKHCCTRVSLLRQHKAFPEMILQTLNLVSTNENATDLFSYASNVSKPWKRVNCLLDRF